APHQTQIDLRPLRRVRQRPVAFGILYPQSAALLSDSSPPPRANRCTLYLSSHTPSAAPARTTVSVPTDVKSALTRHKSRVASREQETTMAVNLYFDPVSEGICEVLHCTNPAKYRANWAGGVAIRLVCTAHKEEVEGKEFAAEGTPQFGKRR